MKLDTRQRVFGICFLLLICSYECISIKTQIKQNLNAKVRFTTAHQLSKAVSIVQENMDVFNENFDPKDILDVVNGPLFDQAMESNMDMIRPKHLDSFVEMYESAKVNNAKKGVGHALHKAAHSAVPSSHFAAHFGHHHKHHHSKCKKMKGFCIDTSEKSAVGCSTKTLIGKCPGNKDIQCCVGKLERKKVAKSSSSSGSTKKSDDGVGTLKVYFLHAKTTRDLDMIGKSDLLFEVAVGDKRKGTRKAQVSMVHDDTHEIDFTKEADRVYTFRNVRPDAKFSIKLMDDDLLGYEQIGHTNLFKAGENRDAKTAFRYNAEECPKNTMIKKLKSGNKVVCNGGSIKFSSRFTPGRVAVPGQENDKVVTKYVQGFPNYDLDSFQRKGTSSERVKARFHGAIGGLLVGLLFGLPDLFKDSEVKAAGRNFLSDAGEAGQTVFKQFGSFQEKVGKELKSGLKLRSIKVFLKELLQILKSFVNFFVTLFKKNVIWKMLFMMVGMMVVFIVAGIVMAAAGVPAIAMTIINVLFALPYVWDQAKLVGPNFVTCKKQADGCTLQNLNKGFGAIGRIIGTIAVEMLMMGAFRPLASKAKQMMSKNKPSLAKNMDVDGLTNLKKSAAGKNSKAAKQVGEDMPCKICGRRRRLFQSSCCFNGRSNHYSSDGSANGNVLTGEALKRQKEAFKHAEWKAKHKTKTFDNDAATRNRLLGRGGPNKLIEGLGDHVKYPNQALNPHLFEKSIKAPKGHIFKWNHGVKQKITKYQKDYNGYLQYKNWGGQKPDPLKLVDWDGATEALRKDAVRGVQPPIESIVPGAPGSRWKLADELVGIVTDQNYKGHLDGNGYPLKWDDAVFGKKLDMTWERGSIPTKAELADYKALIKTNDRAAKTALFNVDFNTVAAKVDDPTKMLTIHSHEAMKYAEAATGDVLAGYKKQGVAFDSKEAARWYKQALEKYRDLKIAKGVSNGANGYGARTSNVIYNTDTKINFVAPSR